MLFSSGEVAEIKQKLHNEILLRKAAESEFDNLNNQLIHWKNTEVFIVLVNFLHLSYQLFFLAKFVAWLLIVPLGCQKC